MRTLITFSPTTLIVLSSMSAMSVTFGVMSGLVAILVYASTDSLEAGLALGLLTSLPAPPQDAKTPGGLPSSRPTMRSGSMSSAPRASE